MTIRHEAPPVTVAQFIAFLQTLPQEAEVEVVNGSHDGYSHERVEITPEWEGATGSRNVEVVDFSNNPWVKPEESYFGKTIVTIGYTS